MTHFDVLIIGAGLSGISAGYHLQTRCPDKTYTILEGRQAIGGTWDLFKYPGIRSDSDMFTFGYRFRPWRGGKTLADGPSIKRYIEDTAREHGIDSHIRFEHRVVHAAWSSADARWTVTARVGSGDGAPETTFTCHFLYCCTGYYRYDRGYTPTWPNMDVYRGTRVHPQLWPDSLDTTGKRIVVIGSGATAVTLVPALAETAAHVTMLQRSPTYIASMPQDDRVARLLHRVLPENAAYAASRWKNILRSQFFYQVARRRPGVFKWMLRKGVEAALGKDFDVATHFTPRYEPWDERLCIVPEGDLFRALRSGRADIMTDEIEAFTETGLRLKSGTTVDADIIVTATGLELKLMHGLSLAVDGKPIELRETTAYKMMMYSDIPNLASAYGYTNASWTLKCDLVAEHVCRLLKFMDAHGYAQCTPRLAPAEAAKLTEPVIGLRSGYVQRALPELPRQGPHMPWRLHQNYLKDLTMLRYGTVEDPALEFRSLAGARETTHVAPSATLATGGNHG